MAYAMLKQRTSAMKSIGQTWRHFASLSVGADLVAAAPNVSLQKARSWDEGVSSKFSVTPLSDIFKGKKVVIFGLPGAFTGVCTAQHVPSYKKNIDKFKAKGVDSVICVSVNDPYTMNGWAEKLEAKEAYMEHGMSIYQIAQSLYT
ncbi:peroxiredoxin-2F, mitochondrial [Tanacetum coccineum]